MSGLAFASAPRPSLPMRFLVAALAWGAVAGLWLAWQGEIALLSRWTPATLVLVHVFALGLLGNAMLGSLVQFLPVAVGSPLPGTRVVPWLHAAFNAGLALLLATFAASSHALALPAGGLLGGSLAIFALLALAAVIRGKGARVVREGIGLALLALTATAAQGLLLLAARTGWRGPAAAGMVDVHAAFGVIGWVLGLLVAVGGVTLPMLQGTRTLPVPALRTWQIASMLTLGISVATLADVVPGSAWRLAAWPPAAFALTVYVLQARAPHRRNPVLRRFWQAGCACLFAASLLALRPDVPLVPLGVLVLGVGLPLLVVGMALEITAFLTWIALRQRVPRGVRVPGVGSLFEEAYRRRAFVLHAVAGAWLVAAAFAPALARGAGLAIALAYAVSPHGQWRCWRQAVTWGRDDG